MLQRSMLIIPCLNPDGIELALHGSKSAGAMSQLTDRISGGDYSRWSANARGVDLHRNFGAGGRPAGEPASGGFSGQCPMSEPESRAAQT
jgi:g-D-glutamyl-meso-diaminopimelate peptidase